MTEAVYKNDLVAMMNIFDVNNNNVSQLQNQITNEFTAELVYRNLAYICQQPRFNFQGLAKYCLASANEERAHGETILTCLDNYLSTKFSLQLVNYDPMRINSELVPEYMNSSQNRDLLISREKLAVIDGLTCSTIGFDWEECSSDKQDMARYEKFFIYIVLLGEVLILEHKVLSKLSAIKTSNRYFEDLLDDMIKEQYESIAKIVGMFNKARSFSDNIYLYDSTL